MKTEWTANDIPTQVGRRVLITGANSGIGWEAALELARRGAEIILPARSEAKAGAAIARIRSQVPKAKLVPEILDLADLRSVHAFASRVVARYPGRSLDLLINNAGVMAIPKRELTVDGYERQFATNYLGPFALTALLFWSIKPQPGSRIVTVSSTASKFGKIDFGNLQSERRYNPLWQAYSQSKLADSIFALELQRRLTAIGSPILSTAAHPGYATTNLQVTGPGEGSWMMRVSAFLMRPQDAAHGALPTLFAATAPEAQPGGYYGPDGFQELKGHPAPAKIASKAKDLSVSKKLWSESERLTSVRFDLLPASQ
ncbi:MAG: oxidoreductase [Acidobacteriota bacterium]|nr:oxidoreductase [Acidobacteriota bacterium]